MKPIAPALAALLALSVQPALAQDVPEEADMLLWCGSAFALMGGGAETEEDMENYFLAREIVLGKAAEILYAAQFPEDQLPGLVTIYDDRVIEDFTTGDISYESEDCIDALDL